MFERAAREKFRFTTPQGMLTVEDLWDLPLTARAGSRVANLDDIAKELNKKVKATEEETFVPRRRKRADTVAAAMLEIVKHVITVKVEEEEAAETAKAAKDRKQLLLGLIAKKENEKLEQSSVDELRAMVEAL